MRRLAAILIITAVLLCGCASSGSESGNSGNESSSSVSSASYRQVTQDEAAALMKSESGYIILDVRTEEEFAGGHIPNAVCIPYDTITDADIPQLPDKNRLILVYCRSGRRSKIAAQQLAENGYTNVVEFGGVNTWQGELVK